MLIVSLIFLLVFDKRHFMNSTHWKIIKRVTFLYFVHRPLGTFWRLFTLVGETQRLDLGLDRMIFVCWKLQNMKTILYIISCVRSIFFIYLHLERSKSDIWNPRTYNIRNSYETRLVFSIQHFSLRFKIVWPNPSLVQLWLREISHREI